MIAVSLQEAKEKLEELLDKAFAGETIEIHCGERKAKLQAAETDASEPEPPPRQWGLLKGKGWIADDFNAPIDDFEDYMR